MTDLILLVAATVQAVRIWNYSYIMARPRNWRDLGCPRAPAFLCKLLSCSHCLSVWVALAFSVLLFIPLGWIVVYALGVSYLANTTHDLLKSHYGLSDDAYVSEDF